MRTMLLGFSLLLTVGCTDTTTPEQSQLESALETWDVHGPSSYSYTWKKDCFCTTETTAPIRITVANGAITDAVYVDGGEPVGADVRSQLKTIDGVFATIQDAVSSGADAINVSYDPNAGFPLTVAIDYELQAADEELAITISDFRSELAHAGQGISCGGR